MMLGGRDVTALIRVRFESETPDCICTGVKVVFQCRRKAWIGRSGWRPILADQEVGPDVVVWCKHSGESASSGGGVEISKRE